MVQTSMQFTPVQVLQAARRAEAEGKMDQAKADMKNTVEDVKDAFRDDDR